MSARWLLPLLLFCLPLQAAPSQARLQSFSFGVIGPSFKAAAEETVLSEAISEADEENLKFVVANGIKASDEPCSDAIYSQRKALLNEARSGLILSLTSGDWADCKRGNGRSAAMDRLNRVRELFFGEDYSFGAERIPVTRQSATPKFRNNGENARWEVGSILFATINLPANNNHYLPDAGRNSEFEDRSIANRDWLNRLFKLASRKKLKGIVLFCDGNPLSVPSAAALAGVNGRDGFLEVRGQLRALSARFGGRVLVVHGAPAGRAAAPVRIAWRGNLGSLAAPAGWVKVTADPAAAVLFAASAPSDLPREAGEQ